MLERIYIALRRGVRRCCQRTAGSALPIQRFVQDRRGSILPLFAVAIVPIIAFVGAAVDYSRVSAARTQMQSALDATALMLSKEAPNLSSTELSQKATAYFNSLFNRPEIQNVNISATYSAAGGAGLIINGSGTIKSTMTNVFNITDTTFAGTSTVKWGLYQAACSARLG